MLVAVVAVLYSKEMTAQFVAVSACAEQLRLLL